MATETKTIALYNDEIKITFYPKSHHYKLDGRRLIGVTTALSIINKPALLPWAANQACNFIIESAKETGTITMDTVNEARNRWRDVRDQAAASGTLVHEWVENYIKGNDQDMPEDHGILNGVTAFLDWVSEHKVEFISSERIIYSRKHDFVGTMDAEAVIDGKRCVIDFKTSKYIYPEMRYQTAAYQVAAQEEGSKYDADRWIVRFDKRDGSFEAKQIGDLEEDFAAFVAALTLKKREKEINILSK